LAQIVHGRRPSALAAPISVNDLEAAIKAIRRIGANGGQHFGGTWTVNAAERLVSQLRATGQGAIASPWQESNSVGAPHVLGWWSIDAHIRRAQAIVRAAVETYQYAVTRWLPAFRTQLRTVRLSPFRVVGSVGRTRHGSIDPYVFRWYLEPLGWSEDTEDVWTEMSMEEMQRDDERLLAAYDNHMARRPDAPSITIHHGMPALSSGRPAAVLATAMLWDDLAEWKWTSGAAPFELSMLLSAIQ
jgi:hypothetical protein